MESTQIDQENLIKQMYGYASMLYKRGMNSYEVKTALMERGLDEANATYIVNNFEQQMGEVYKNKAQKDMLYGALWCVGGIVLTLAHIGFIFWGAIVFGAIQFFRGLSNM
jgi:hypothetical protein